MGGDDLKSYKTVAIKSLRRKTKAQELDELPLDLVLKTAWQEKREETKRSGIGDADSVQSYFSWFIIL